MHVSFPTTLTPSLSFGESDTVKTEEDFYVGRSSSSNPELSDDDDDDDETTTTTTMTIL